MEFWAALTTPSLPACPSQGPIHCALTVLREEGIRGMWSGASPTVMRNGTNQMCLFWAKANMDVILWNKHEGDGKQLSPVQSMTSGGLAAVLGPCATGPFDVIKTRLMAQSKAGGNIKYKGFFDALVKIPREEGLLSLWCVAGLIKGERWVLGMRLRGSGVQVQGRRGRGVKLAP